MNVVATILTHNRLSTTPLVLGIADSGVRSRHPLLVLWLMIVLNWLVGMLFHSISLSGISNDPSFRQKHPGVPDGSDSFDGTSYTPTENYTLPVAHATGLIAHVPPLLLDDVYTPSEGHMCYTLRSGCSYAEAVLSPAAASLEMLLVDLEIIATSYRSMIFKTYAFRLYSHLCIYVSI